MICEVYLRKNFTYNQLAEIFDCDINFIKKTIRNNI